jgi:hypothetical protein
VNALNFAGGPTRAEIKMKKDVRLTFTNIRANANALGVVGGGLELSIIAVIKVPSAEPSEPIPITAARVLRSFDFSLYASREDQPLPFIFRRSLGVNPYLGSRIDDVVPAFYMRFAEDTLGAFKNRSEEAGYSTQPGSAALVDRGTCLRAIFSPIPDNVRVFVTQQDIVDESVVWDRVDSPRATLTSSDLISGTLWTPVLALNVGWTRGSGIAELHVVDGRAEAIWEWVAKNDDAQMKRQVAFAVVLAARPGEALLGTAAVAGSLFPVSRATTASQDDPIPRFVDTSVWLKAFTIEP